MRLLSPIAGLLLLAGCASSPTIDPSVGAGPTRIMETGTGTDVHLSTDTRTVAEVIAAPQSAVWTAALETYQALGIPITTANQQTRILGNQSFETSRRLNNKMLSHYVSCGSNLSGEVANNARVRFDILSMLRPQDTGTVIETRVMAAARSNDGTSTNAVVCSSTGRLEQEIAQAVKLRSAAAAGG